MDGRGNYYEFAVQAVLNCLEGNGRCSPEAARYAFVEAAKEAGIFVREGR